MRSTKRRIPRPRGSAHAASRLASAAELDPALEDAKRDAETAGVHAAEAAQQLRRYLQKLEVDPGRLSQLDARIKAVLDAARKYRAEAAALPQALEERRARLAELGGEESLEKLKAQEAGGGARIPRRRGGAFESAPRGGQEARRRSHQDDADACHGGRKARSGAGAAGNADLRGPGGGGVARGRACGAGIGAARQGRLGRRALAHLACDPGAALRAGSVPTLIFDEVDSGIGGGVAEVVGKLLAALARHHQVLSVTHLAQVAVHARSQLRVAKQTRGNTTLATVAPLAAPERVEEIARMLGGLTITEATRRHASELLQTARDGGISPSGEKRKAASGPR
jgi:DNA repair protein RecN (Recombination protein N)